MEMTDCHATVVMARGDPDVGCGCEGDTYSVTGNEQKHELDDSKTRKDICVCPLGVPC